MTLTKSWAYIQDEHRVSTMVIDKIEKEIRNTLQSELTKNNYGISIVNCSALMLALEKVK